MKPEEVINIKKSGVVKLQNKSNLTMGIHNFLIKITK